MHAATRLGPRLEAMRATRAPRTAGINPQSNVTTTAAASVYSTMRELIATSSMRGNSGARVRNTAAAPAATIKPAAAPAIASIAVSTNNCPITVGAQRAERITDRDLALALRRASQQQCRDVRAGDQQ